MIFIVDFISWGNYWSFTVRTPVFLVENGDCQNMNLFAESQSVFMGT